MEDVYIYEFYTYHDIIGDVLIVSNAIDTKTLGRLWLFYDTFKVKRNQILKRKEKVN